MSFAQPLWIHSLAEGVLLDLSHVSDCPIKLTNMNHQAEYQFQCILAWRLIKCPISIVFKTSRLRLCHGVMHGTTVVGEIIKPIAQP